MEAVATALEAWVLAEWLRYSRWGYAAINTSHILGISLLIGASITLDLRLLGFWRSIELSPFYRFLSRLAATGLGIAMASGLMLFSVRATEYIALDLFLAKIALVAAGAALAIVMHLRLDPEQGSLASFRLAGALSLLIWPTVLVCGRLLAFV